MDIDKIIQERKEKDEQQRRDAEANARAKEEAKILERVRREANAAKIETHLKTVVGPVFFEAEKKLSAAGYNFGISETCRTDRDFGNPKAFALGLKLARNGEPIASIEFEGDFESVTLSPREAIGPVIPILEPPMPLNEVTPQYVEQRTSGFVRAALGL